jgi:hypothetical protein
METKESWINSTNQSDLWGDLCDEEIIHFINFSSNKQTHSVDTDSNDNDQNATEQEQHDVWFGDILDEDIVTLFESESQQFSLTSEKSDMNPSSVILTPTATKTEQKISPTRSDLLTSRLGVSKDDKAGLEKVDVSKVNQIIYENSKDSRFF